MKKVGRKTRSWIMGFHVLFAAAWVGSALGLVLISFTKLPAPNGDELYAFCAAAKLIDDFLIIPAALGSLFTGLLISMLTNWGFFKHWWVTIKWTATVVFIVFGTFWLGPWLNNMTAIASHLRAGAVSDPVFTHNLVMNRGFGSLQVFLLIVLIFITELKPWGRLKKQDRVERMKP